jgi:hypothetical protein
MSRESALNPRAVVVLKRSIRIDLGRGGRGGVDRGVRPCVGLLAVLRIG